MKYVAVGFKVNRMKSIFYISDEEIANFLNRLANKMEEEEPDFVSIRCVRDE